MLKYSIHLRKTMICAVCMTLCIILPLAFHLIPDGGTLFSPMHLPVFICGLVCGWQYGLLCGLLGPVLSSFLTGMPSIGYLPTMMLELALYGLISGLLIHLLHTKNRTADIYLSLVSAMLLGRIITGIARAFLFAPGSLSIQIWATSYFVSCLPGIIAQLILLPIIYYALAHAKLLPPK